MPAVRLDLTFDCPRCMRPVPYDAVGPTARCRACLHVLTLDAIAWKAAARAVAAALDGDEPGRSTDFSDLTTVSRTRLEDPACPGCDEALDPDALAAARRLYQCACGVAVSVRAPDEVARTLHPDVVWIVGERPDAPIAPVEPVAFRCPRCAGTLRTDGGARALRCGCGADVDVPDALWEALHPVRRRAPVTLLIGGAP